MKMNAFRILVAVVFCSFIFSVSCYAAELVQNGGFEDGTSGSPPESGHGPEGWYPNVDEGKPIFSWESVGHTGQHSVHIVTKTANDVGFWAQNITVEPNKEYTAKVWCRTLSEEAGTGGTLQLLDAKNGVILADWLIPATKDWSEFSKSIPIGNITNIEVRLYLYKSINQEVWFDDCSLTAK